MTDIANTRELAQQTTASPAAAARAEPVTVIEARPDTVVARLRALWTYRAFFGFLFKEMTTRKSRGTLLGFWWLILRPLMTAGAMIFVFSSVRPEDAAGGGLSYLTFFLSGYVPWRLFQSGMINIPRTLGWSQSIMRRTYFPRLLVPLAGFGTTFIEFGVLTVAFVVVVTVASWGEAASPLRLGWHTLLLLPALVGALLFALAFGLVTSIVAMFFRDVIFSIRLFSMGMIFMTPVGFKMTIFPESYRWVIYALNPMAQIVETSRIALTGQGDIQVGFLLLAYGTILATLVAGVAFFLRAETHLGDQM